MSNNLSEVFKLHHLLFSAVWCLAVKLQYVFQLPSVIASIKQEYWSFDVRVSVLKISKAVVCTEYCIGVSPVP